MEKWSIGRVVKRSDMEGIEFTPAHSHYRGWTFGEGSVRRQRFRRTIPRAHQQSTGHSKSRIEEGLCSHQPSPWRKQQNEQGSFPRVGPLGKQGVGSRRGDGAGLIWRKPPRAGSTIQVGPKSPNKKTNYLALGKPMFCIMI